MPLYGYAMPAQVLQLLTEISETCKESNEFTESLKKKSFGFIIQYGFTEAVHGRPLESYLMSYVESIGANYIGTVIKGGCDALYDQKKH